jgi:hypothetical protein
VKEGAKLVYGGTRCPRAGYFFTPAIFTDVEDHMFVAHEESFGPIMIISKFSSKYVFVSFIITFHTLRTYIPLTKGKQRLLGHFSETPIFYQNYLAMSNEDVTCGKPIVIKINESYISNTYHPYTTCLVHTLSSRNLPVLKGAYKSYVRN